jgi:hypothetical protein
LIRTSAFYAILVCALLYLQYFQNITIPLTFENETYLFDPTFLLIPLLALIVFNYASKVVKNVVIGKLGSPISTGLNWLGLSACFWLFSLDPNFPSTLQPLSNYIIIITTVMILRSITTEILNDRNQIIGESITHALSILILGFLASRLWLQIHLLMEEYHIFTVDTLMGREPWEILFALFYSGLAEVLDEAILMGLIFISALSVTKMFRHHSNPYLDFIGKNVSTSLGNKFLGTLVFLLYLLFIRSFMLNQTGINPQLVTLGEWIVVCLISYVIYRRTRTFVSESMTVDEKIGFWTRHIQEIEHTSDLKLDNLSKLIESFLYTGDKNELIVYLVDVFRRFNVSVSRINHSISELLDHREIEVGLTTFNWQRRMLERLNIERRLQALDAVMKKLQETSLQMSYSTRGVLAQSNVQTSRQEVQ